MEILIDPQKTGDVLGLVASVAKEQSPLAFLAGLVLETEGASHVKASSSDAEVAVTALVPAQVREPGRVCVNAKSLMEVLRRSEGRAAVIGSGEGGRVNCVLGQSRYQLGLVAADAPSFALDLAAKKAEIPAADLALMIADVKSAAGTDASRYVLNSVLLEKKGRSFRAVATDGRRLATRESTVSSGGEDFSFPVPSGAVRALDRAFALVEEGASVAISFDGEKMAFRVGGIQVAARALEGKYPAWRDAVPKEAEAAFFAVDADKLCGALEGLIRVVGDPAEVRIERRSESSLVLSAEGRLNAGEEVVETAAPLGPLQPVRINGRYLLDAIQPGRGSLVRLGLIRSDRPVLVQSINDAAYRAVVMPLLSGKEGEKETFITASR